jgi:hypothetical protein
MIPLTFKKTLTTRLFFKKIMSYYLFFVICFMFLLDLKFYIFE